MCTGSMCVLCWACKRPCDFAFVSTVVTSNKLNMKFCSLLFWHSLGKLLVGFYSGEVKHGSWSSFFSGLLCWSCQ